MSGTNTIVMGDRGRLVLPQSIRERHGITAGTTLVVIESEGGLLLLTQRELMARVRSDLAGPSLVDELIAERRAAAGAEKP